MNKERRSTLADIIDELTSLKERIEDQRSKLDDVISQETEAIENVPENLQDSDRFVAMQENCDNMETAAGYIDDALDNLEQAIVELQEIE